jgi:hypothetical protein
MNHRCQLGGLFRWEKWSKNGRLLVANTFWNGIPLAARDGILDGYFNGGSVTSNWYMGIIDDDSFTALADADTMLSHAGWAEITAYAETTRPAWGKGAAAASGLNNATLATFTFTAAKNAGGLFIASDNTKGGTAGVLWATGLGDQMQEMNPGEILRASYALQFASVD